MSDAANILYDFLTCNTLSFNSFLISTASSDSAKSLTLLPFITCSVITFAIISIFFATASVLIAGSLHIFLSC